LIIHPAAGNSNHKGFPALTSNEGAAEGLNFEEGDEGPARAGRNVCPGFRPGAGYE